MRGFFCYFVLLGGGAVQGRPQGVMYNVLSSEKKNATLSTLGQWVFGEFLSPHLNQELQMRLVGPWQSKQESTMIENLHPRFGRGGGVVSISDSRQTMTNSLPGITSKRRQNKSFFSFVNFQLLHLYMT